MDMKFKLKARLMQSKTHFLQIPILITLSLHVSTLLGVKSDVNMQKKMWLTGVLQVSAPNTEPSQKGAVSPTTIITLESH